ncbi:MAG: hypothetical protein ABH821_03700 [archaeon]
MFNVTTKLLLHKHLQLEKGRVMLFNQRSMMVPTAMITNLVKEFEDDYAIEIYQVCREEGIKWYKNMEKNFGKMSVKKNLDWGTKIITLAGWGEMEIVNVDHENKTIIIELKNSGIARFWGKNSKAVDHVFRGMVAGGLSHIFKTDIDGIETHCLAKGDKVCRFTFKKEFDKTQKIVKEQLGEI